MEIILTPALGLAGICANPTGVRIARAQLGKLHARWRLRLTVESLAPALDLAGVFNNPAGVKTARAKTRKHLIGWCEHSHRIVAPALGFAGVREDPAGMRIAHAQARKRHLRRQ